GLAALLQSCPESVDLALAVAPDREGDRLVRREPGVAPVEQDVRLTLQLEPDHHLVPGVLAGVRPVGFAPRDAAVLEERAVELRRCVQVVAYPESGGDLLHDCLLGTS